MDVLAIVNMMGSLSAFLCNLAKEVRELPKSLEALQARLRNLDRILKIVCFFEEELLPNGAEMVQVALLGCYDAMKDLTKLVESYNYESSSTKARFISLVKTGKLKGSLERATSRLDAAQEALQFAVGLFNTRVLRNMQKDISDIRNKVLVMLEQKTVANVTNQVIVADIATLSKQSEIAEIADVERVVRPFTEINTDISTFSFTYNTSELPYMSLYRTLLAPGGENGATPTYHLSRDYERQKRDYRFFLGKMTRVHSKSVIWDCGSGEEKDKRTAIVSSQTKGALELMFCSRLIPMGTKIFYKRSSYRGMPLPAWTITWDYPFRVPNNSPVIEACRKNDMSRVRDLFIAGQASVYDYDQNGCLISHVVLNSNEQHETTDTTVQLVKSLVELGADSSQVIPAVLQAYDSMKDEFRTDRSLINLGTASIQQYPRAVARLDEILRFCLQRAKADPFSDPEIRKSLWWATAACNSNSLALDDGIIFQDQEPILESLYLESPEQILETICRIGCHLTKNDEDLKWQLSSKYRALQELCMAGLIKNARPQASKKPNQCSGMNNHMIFRLIHGVPEPHHRHVGTARCSTKRRCMVEEHVQQMLTLLFQYEVDPWAICNCSDQLWSKGAPQTALRMMMDRGLLSTWQDSLKEANMNPETSEVLDDILLEGFPQLFDPTHEPETLGSWQSIINSQDQDSLKRQNTLSSCHTDSVRITRLGAIGYTIVDTLSCVY